MKKKHPFLWILYFKDNFVKYKYCDHKCVVNQTPASGVSFSHIKPAEVPDSTTQPGCFIYLFYFN